MRIRSIISTKLAVVLLVTQVLSGCNGGMLTTGGNGSDDEPSQLSILSKGLLCAAGGVLGYHAGKKLAEFAARRTGKNLSARDLDDQAKAYKIGLALAFCAGTMALGNSVYAKLSEEGRKNREKALQDAIASSRQRSYSDPQNPALKGTVKPTKQYTDVASNRNCVDIEDRLQSEQIYQKYCQNPDSGAWEPVTA